MLKKVMFLLVMTLLLVTPVFANEAPKATLVQVTGNSQKEVAPDVARITLTVNSIHGKLDRAKADNTLAVNRVLAALAQQGVYDDQIKTDTYQVNPIYEYEKDRLPVLKGYRVTQSLDVCTSIDKVGTVINEATNAGVNEIHSIRFETANETESKNEALKDAVRDAMKKAEVIAAALNKRVARVALVNETGVFYQPLLENRMLKAAAMDGAAPSIPAGKVTVGANVQVTVELE